MAKKKQSKNPTDILARKKDKLDWGTFNFLENLLVFCIEKDKSVPPESGVKFQISVEENDSIRLLFNTDRRKDSLFRNDEIKPDYMVLYVKRDLCLCTIIEMKGTTERGARHGIDQIKTLHARLKEEIKNHLPNKFKVKFQAILLTQFNADIPRNRIIEEKAKGLTILPLQYNNRAELFDYISKENQITEKYIDQNIQSKSHNLSVEGILTDSALPERINDSFSLTNKEKAANKDGIYINYALHSEGSYAALAIDNTGMKIGVNETGENYTNKIKSDLQKLGLKANQHYEFKQIG